MRYAIIEGMEIREMKNANDIKSFAMARLAVALREENDTTLSYLEGWAEHLSVNSDDGEVFEASQICDTVADNLTYSNIHLQVLGRDSWNPISNDEKDEFYAEICRILEGAV